MTFAICFYAGLWSKLSVPMVLIGMLALCILIPDTAIWRRVRSDRRVLALAVLLVTGALVRFVLLLDDPGVIYWCPPDPSWWECITRGCC